MSFRKKAAALAALQIFAVFTIVSFVPVAPVMAEEVPSQIIGDWVIPENATLEYWGGKLNITGNIIISSGASLTLRKSTIEFNQDWEGSGGIDVTPSGQLHMDGARVLSGNGYRYNWLFEQTSVGVIKNSNISDVAQSWSGAGITIESTLVTFESNDIHDSAFGFLIQPNTSPKILNNTIRDTDFDGIFLQNSGAQIKGNLFKNTNQQGDGANQGYAAATLYMRQPNMPTFEDNVLINNKIAGVDIIDINGMEIKNCVFNNPNAQDIKVDGLQMDTALKAYRSNFTTVQLNKLWQDLGAPNGMDATFTPYFDVDVHVTLDSTGSAVPGATIDVKTEDGDNVLLGKKTDSVGWARDLEVAEYEMHNNGTTGSQTVTDDYKPHVVWASADIDGTALTSSTTVDIDRNDMEIEVVIDDLAPFLELDEPLEGTITNGTDIDFKGRTEPDAILRIKTVPVVLNPDGSFVYNVKLNEGNNAIKVVATDPSGNPTEATVNVRKDTFAPQVTILSPENGTTLGNPNPFVTGTAEYGSKLWINNKIVQVQPDGTFNTTIRLAEGENTLRAIARDAVNNTDVDEVIVFLDSTAPILTLVEPVDGRRTNVAEISVMGVTERDATVTVNGIPIMLQGSTFKYTLTLVEGENVIVVRSIDLNGNTATRMVTAYLDTVAPDIVVTFPPPEYETNQDKIVVTGTTEVGATVKINGLTAENVGGVYSKEVKLEKNINAITVTASDDVGNSMEREFRVFKDNIPPELRVQNPKDGSVLNKKAGGKVEVRGTTEDGATVFVNGERAGVAGTSFQLWVYLAEGNNTLAVTAMDPAGNAELQLLHVVYDSHVDFQVLTPSDGLTTGANEIKASGFVEPGGTVQLNGVSVVVNDKGGFNQELRLKDGRNTVTFVFTDDAGNEETVTRYVTKESSGVQSSASSLPLSILFIVVIIVLVVVMAVFMMKGRRPKVEEAAPGEPAPPQFGPGTDLPPAYGEGVDPDQPPPPPPEIYQQDYSQDQGQEGYYGEGYDQTGYDQAGYDQTGYDQEGYDQGYTDEGHDQAPVDDSAEQVAEEPLEDVDGSEEAVEETAEDPFAEIEAEPGPEPDMDLDDDGPPGPDQAPRPRKSNDVLDDILDEN